MQAARGAPGIDSCSMGEWALGRGLVVVCPPMAGSCINFLKPLTQTGNQPPEHSSINQRKNWQRNNLVGRRKGLLENLLGNMKLQKSWISWLTIDGSGLLLFTKYFRPFLFPSQSNQSGKCSKCSKVFSLCYIWSRKSEKMFYLRLFDMSIYVQMLSGDPWQVLADSAFWNAYQSFGQMPGEQGRIFKPKK